MDLPSQIRAQSTENQLSKSHLFTPASVGPTSSISPVWFNQLGSPGYFDVQGQRHEFLRNGDELNSSDIAKESKDTNTDDSKLEEGFGQSISRCPDSLIQYVLPALETFHWTFMIACKFRYIAESRKHVRIDDGLPRKATVVLLQLLSVFFLWNNVNRLTSADELQNNRIGIIYRTAYICFALLTVTLYWTLWSHRESIRILLARVEVVGMELMKDPSCRLPIRSRVKHGVWATIGLCGMYSVAYTLVFEIIHGDFRNLRSPTLVLTAVVREAELNLYYGTGWIELKNRTDLEGYNVGTAVLIGVTYLIIVQYQTMTWISAFVSVLLWGLLFRRLFQTYFDILDRHRAKDRFKLRYIRMFQKITILIEDYNRIFGMNILFAIMSCILYLSINSWNMFTSFGSNIGVNVLVAYSCVMIAVVLLVCSEVNNMANQMSMTIKIFYQQQGLWRLALQSWQTTCVNEQLQLNIQSNVLTMESFLKCAEVTQGLSMIQHDLQANSIGFKGYGFFTISYSFMGTVISVLITYSVMFQQWRGTTEL